MTLSAEQYAQIAEGYEKASADPLLPAEERVNLAKEADWFRFLAQREGAHRPNNEHELTAPSSLDFEPNSQGWSWRSTAPFLTTLWITGAAVYLVSTVLFTNAVNLFGRDEPKTPAPEIRQSVESVLKVPSVTNTAEQANEQPMATSERRHAITPDQPPLRIPAPLRAVLSIAKGTACRSGFFGAGTVHSLTGRRAHHSRAIGTGSGYRRSSPQRDAYRDIRSHDT